MEYKELPSTLSHIYKCRKCGYSVWNGLRKCEQCHHSFTTEDVEEMKSNYVKNLNKDGHHLYYFIMIIIFILGLLLFV